MASLSLADIEGGPRECQTLQEKDPDVRMAVVYPSDSAADITTGMKIMSGDANMAGVE